MIISSKERKSQSENGSKIRHLKETKHLITVPDLERMDPSAPRALIIHH